jgi:hypothetical protein
VAKIYKLFKHDIQIVINHAKVALDLIYPGVGEPLYLNLEGWFMESNGGNIFSWKLRGGSYGLNNVEFMQ